jgi:hypothetical protein
MSERIFKTPAPSKAYPDITVSSVNKATDAANVPAPRMGAAIPDNQVRNLPNRGEK